MELGSEPENEQGGLDEEYVPQDEDNESGDDVHVDDDVSDDDIFEPGNVKSKTRGKGTKYKRKGAPNKKRTKGTLLKQPARRSVNTTIAPSEKTKQTDEIDNMHETFNTSAGFWVYAGHRIILGGLAEDRAAINALRDGHDAKQQKYYGHMHRKRFWSGRTQSRARGLPPAIRLEFAKRFLAAWAAQHRARGSGPGQRPYLVLAAGVLAKANNFFFVKAPRVVDYGMRLALQHMIVQWPGLPEGFRHKTDIIARAKAYRELFPVPDTPAPMLGGWADPLVLGVPRTNVLDYWRRAAAAGGNDPAAYAEVMAQFFQQLVYVGEVEFVVGPVHFYSGGHTASTRRAPSLSKDQIKWLLDAVTREPWLTLENVVARFREASASGLIGLGGLIGGLNGLGGLIGGLNGLAGPDRPRGQGSAGSELEIRRIMGQFQKFLTKSGFIKGLPHEIDVVRATNEYNIKDVQNFRNYYVNQTTFGPGHDVVFMDETTVSLEQRFGRVWMARQAPVLHGTKSTLRGLHNMFITIGVVAGEPFLHWVLYRPQRLDGVLLNAKVNSERIDSMVESLDSLRAQQESVAAFIDGEITLKVKTVFGGVLQTQEYNDLLKNLKYISLGLADAIQKNPALLVEVKEQVDQYLEGEDTSEGVLERSVLSIIAETCRFPDADLLQDVLRRAAAYAHLNVKGVEIGPSMLAPQPLVHEQRRYIVRYPKSKPVSLEALLLRTLIGHVGMRARYGTPMRGSPQKVHGTIGSTLDYFFGTYHARHPASFEPYHLFAALRKAYEAKGVQPGRLDVLVDQAPSHMAQTMRAATHARRNPLFGIMRRHGALQLGHDLADVRLVYLPAKAPEFSPCERINALMKRYLERGTEKRFTERLLGAQLKSFFDGLPGKSVFNLVRGCGYKFAHDEQHREQLGRALTITDEEGLEARLAAMCNNPDPSSIANMPLADRYFRRRHVLCVDPANGQLVKYFSPMSMNVNNMYRKRPGWTYVSKHETLFNNALVPIHAAMADTDEVRRRVDAVRAVQVRYSGYDVPDAQGIALQSRQLSDEAFVVVPDTAIGGLELHEADRFWDLLMHATAHGYLVAIRSATATAIAEPDLPAVAVAVAVGLASGSTPVPASNSTSATPATPVATPASDAPFVFQGSVDVEAAAEAAEARCSLVDVVWALEDKGTFAGHIVLRMRRGGGDKKAYDLGSVLLKHSLVHKGAPDKIDQFLRKADIPAQCLHAELPRTSFFAERMEGAGWVFGPNPTLYRGGNQSGVNQVATPLED